MQQLQTVGSGVQAMAAIEGLSGEVFLRLLQEAAAIIMSRVAE
jgi:hypothetical protein